ncbi:MAG: hypothetical protein LBQ14_08165, partial [Treponema sp.]|nr:hypothetical protein [Treponema sp.]
LDPAQAALLSSGDTLNKAGGSADGTVSGSALMVASADPLTGAVTFSSGSGTYLPGDYLVFPGSSFVNLRGSVSWDHSMAEGADKAPGSGSLITGGFLDANYRPHDDLTTGGDSSLRPSTAGDIVDQCFERFGPTNYVTAGTANVAGMIAAMEGLFTGPLYRWSSDVLYPDIVIENYLAFDNGGAKGDQRAPESDGTRKPIGNAVGAYEW